MNFILRPVFTRPEMLYVSIKYEIMAREFNENDDYFTIFVVDHGGDPGCLDVIKNYPFKHTVINRPFRYRPCANILEGLKTAALAKTKEGPEPEYIINLEEDCVLHKTYFNYVNEATKILKDRKYSVITSWGLQRDGDPSVLKRGAFSCGPGTIINLDFFRQFMLPYANVDYYKNFVPTITAVNERNVNFKDVKYSVAKGNHTTHLDWDGLMNRLVDTAIYEEDVYSYSSLCFRLLHIGFYGYNRHGVGFPAELKTFDERVSYLEKIVFEPEALAKLDGHYKDYSVFDDKLEKWDGKLEIADA